MTLSNYRLLGYWRNMEMELYRLKICGEQARLGVVFIGKYQVNCDGIQLIAQPNQVLPHTHKIKLND